MQQAAQPQEQDYIEWASTNILTLQKKTLTSWENIKANGNGTRRERTIRHLLFIAKTNKFEL